MDRICSLTAVPFTVSPFEQDICRANGFPLPTLAPVERLRQLSAFRSRTSLSHRICALTGKKMLSGFAADAPHTIVDIEAWEGDGWDGLDYGQEYDFRRPFFDQVAELFVRVPLPNLAVVKSTMENSDFTNGITAAKNCYLLFAASYCEDSMYSLMAVHSKSVMDCSLIWHSELCYGCVNVQRCYNLKFSEHCVSCTDSAFLFNCLSCRDCFGCSNLVRAQYCLYNEQLTKDEYFRRVSEIDLGSYEVVQREQSRFHRDMALVPLKHFFGVKFENCSGNFISNSKNCQNCYFCDASEDLEWCVWLNGGKTSAFHFSYANGSELVYNSVTVGDQSYDVKFSVECWPGAQNLLYSLYCGRGASHCFGSVGLRKKSYCILNKQYTKEGYEQLKARIIEQMKATGEWGSFFPTAMSPFAYNASDANGFLPLDRSAAEARGYLWQDEEHVPSIAPTYAAPDNIRDVTDEVLAAEIICEATGKRFKIGKAELEFLRRNHLPLPRIAPMERIRRLKRIQQLEPLREAVCVGCGAATITTFAAERPVYCTPCYERQVL